MEKESETYYWLRKTADFMLHIDQYENSDLVDLNKTAVINLQLLSGSKQLYWIEQQDKLTASVSHSIPVPSPSVILDPYFLNSLSGKEPLYLRENPFPALESLAGGKSVVILPLTENSTKGCVMMIWEETIEFSAAFREFIYISFSVMRRVAKVRFVLTEIQQLEVHFNAILQTIPQSVIFIDESGIKSWVNDNASRLFALPAGMVEPSVLAAAMQLFRNKADNRQEIYERGMEFFQSNNKEIREWKWIYSDPQPLVLNVYCTPTNSANVKGVLWMFEDITEEYLADKQIQELNIKLQQASDYKSQFLANMSHELRTPLNSILVLANLLGENDHGNLTARQIRDTEIIANSGNDLLYLIDDILDLSKIEAGKMDLHFDNEKVQGIAQTMSDLFMVVSDSKEITFEIEISEGVPETIITDRHRLNQVIKNLLSNAFKFTPRGGKVRLVFDTDENQELLKISVSDTGIGVEEGKKKEIFEAFKQANGTTSRNYGGTGLGLSISRDLVSKLGGQIFIKSTLGKGSLFLVEIPLSAELEAPDRDLLKREDSIKALEPAEFPDLAAKKILLVSDDVREIFTLNAVLEKHGIIASHIFAGEDFLPQLESGTHPDFIIIDLAMENYSGLDLIRQLSESISLREIPFLLIAPTTFSEETYPGILREEVIYKPVNPIQLLFKIQQLLPVKL